MNVIDALNWRYAVKTFSEAKLQDNQLENLLEAARLSPSSYGLQPYKIIVVKSQALRERLLPFAYGQKQVVNSSHLLVFAARTDIGPHLVNDYVHLALKNPDSSAESLAGFSKMVNNALAEMNNNQALEWAKQQAFIALGNTLTCAALMGIDACPMGGFNAQEFDKELALTARNLTSTVICPVGVRRATDKHGQRSKVRVDIERFVVEM